MKTLYRNGMVADVCSKKLVRADVLVIDGKIEAAGLDGPLTEEETAGADNVIDLNGRILAPGLIDCHIHIESSMLRPEAFAREAIRHGTAAVIADPHEIANVCGSQGLDWMMEDAQNSAIDFYFALPSCVPANAFEENGAVLNAEDLRTYYTRNEVVALGEVMDVPGVLNQDPDLIAKIQDALKNGRVVNGHAPLVSGKDLQTYIQAGITDDHECSVLEEALEKIQAGMHIFIREGTAARNLEALMGLFDGPVSEKCMLAVDDLHPDDLVENGHIDAVIRKSIRLGADPLTALQMGALHPALYYGFQDRGAIAPGKRADLIILSDLQTFDIEAVIKDGKTAYVHPESDLQSQKGFTAAMMSDDVHNPVQIPDEIVHTFHMDRTVPEDFIIPLEGVQDVQVIGVNRDSLLTDRIIRRVDFDAANGVDPAADRVKIASFERHHHTGRHFTGLIERTGLREGAVASSIGHDSHNLTVLGCSEEDMSLAANRVIEMQGGIVVAAHGHILAEMPLPAGGLMSLEEAPVAAAQNRKVLEALRTLQADPEQELLMTLAFMTLSVIPHLKLSPQGLVDADLMERTSLTVRQNKKDFE